MNNMNEKCDSCCEHTTEECHHVLTGTEFQTIGILCWTCMENNSQKKKIIPFKVPKVCLACRKYITDDISDGMFLPSAPHCTDVIENKTCQYRYCKQYVEYIDKKQS